ncbi:MAG: hypothetical protein WB816_05475, partial [Methylocystis sp.]
MTVIFFGAATALPFFLDTSAFFVGALDEIETRLPATDFVVVFVLVFVAAGLDLAFTDACLRAPVALAATLFFPPVFLTLALLVVLAALFVGRFSVRLPEVLAEEPPLRVTALRGVAASVLVGALLVRAPLDEVVALLAVLDDFP